MVTGRGFASIAALEPSGLEVVEEGHVNDKNPVNAERSLLDEIEELQVLEAEELQEGVAFHAFRFRTAESGSEILERIILKTKDKATLFGDKLVLPRGATLLEVHEDHMVVGFSADQVKVDTIKEHVAQTLGDQLSGFDHTVNVKYTLTKTGK
jgi:hypothetical protein